VALLFWRRRAAMRNWKVYAEEIGGEFGARNRFSPAFISASLDSRDLFLETATSYEDEIPYYHTRATMPIRNPGSLILGIRRKSMLEEAQTRSGPTYAELEAHNAGALPLKVLGDPEFERHFFLVCNDHEALVALLTPEVRKELSRYPDIEIYVRRRTVEWRRAGEQADIAVVRRLTDLLKSLADQIDALPKRTITLTRQMEDERLIEKGI
jgi:hypothetical protein